MRRRSALLIVTFTIAVTSLLNTSLGKLPPLGKILDPLQGFWQNAETASPSIPQHLSLLGLEKAVTVRLDQHLISHLTAQSDLDLYFAQGYITALHRLWQMDFHTYAAAGRMAELVGPRALDFDRLQRRKGNLYAASNALASIKENDMLYSIVQAYIAGINAYIASLSYKDLPVEYKLLNYRPELWTPLKVVLMMLQMTDYLCGSDESIEKTNAYHCLGQEKIAFFFPDYFRNNEPVIPEKTPWNFKPVAIKQPSLQVPQLVPQLKRTQPLQISGSNNWVVAGKKTITGAPYLANDPHLTMQLPSIWYGIHLQSPTVNVFGAAIPGLPGVAIGFNEAIAWGVTNTGIIVKDWYVINFKDKTRKEYWYDNLLLKSQFVTEEIKVRGHETFYDTVVYTHLGPVVYDANFQGQKEQQNLAMKWVGHHLGQELLASHLLNRARNFQEFEVALQHYNVPSQNFAFASVQNDIAMWVVGQLPAKWKNQGKFVMPGNTAAYEWQDFIPKVHNPKIINPPSGYVSSANQRSTDEQYPYYYQHYNEEHYRNRRINQVLSKLKGIDEYAMIKLQNDTYNLMAKESLGLLLDHVDTAKLNTEQQSAYETLLAWDFHNDVDQLAPSIFKAWQEQLIATLWKPLRDDPGLIPVPHFCRTMEILQYHPDSPHLDLGPYATIRDLIHGTFEAAVQQLEIWEKKQGKPYRWGDYQEVYIEHLARFPSFGLSNIQVGGGENIINANAGNRGASMRIVVSLDKQPRGWFIYPGGQSGNPGSPYYTNLVEPWRKGQYLPVTLSTEQLEKEGCLTLMLQPKNK